MRDRGRSSPGKPFLSIKPEVGSDVNFGFRRSGFDVASFLLKHVDTDVATVDPLLGRQTARRGVRYGWSRFGNG
jgi:hypothetical protein